MIKNYIKEILIKALKRHEGERVVMSDLMPTLKGNYRKYS